MRTYVSTGTIVLALALIGSLLVHVNIFTVLGTLPLLGPGDSSEAGGTEVELVVTDDPLESEPAPPVPVVPEELRVREEERPEVARPEPTPETPEQVIAERVPAQPVPPSNAQLQSITQRSQSPEVEPPPDARYLARESNRVEEETVARLRNYQEDDPDPSLGVRPNPSAEDEEEGTDTEEEVADRRNLEGSTERTATEEEARVERPEVNEQSPSGETIARAPAPAAASSTGGETPREDIAVVRDAFGEFAVVLPRTNRVGTGEGDDGGERTGEVNRRGAASRSAVAPSSDAIRPERAVTWRTLESTYGREQLETERQAYVEERRSRFRGASHAKRWREFRAAIENYVPNVRVGNQTALNAARSPFADYIAETHRRIHREFADGFLRRAPSVGTSPLADPSLLTELEIILNRDGTVHRIGVVRTSGFYPFDYGAFASVMRAQPYPEAPDAILSGDGRVYMHWGFYRNERQCGTFNATPYILPDPPESVTPGVAPLRDTLAPSLLPRAPAPASPSVPGDGPSEVPSEPGQAPPSLPEPPSLPSRDGSAPGVG